MVPPLKSCLILLIIDCILTGCYKPRPVSIPTITPSQEWHIEENCGYEHCYPLVDFLVGNEVKVRIESKNGIINKDIFTIRIEFITPENSKYKYSPSLSFVTLSNGLTVKSKDFNCSKIIYSRLVFESNNYLINTIPLNGLIHNGLRYDCFILYFSVPPPSIDETYFLDISGLEGNNGPVQFPKLKFVKSIRK